MTTLNPEQEVKIRIVALKSAVKTMAPVNYTDNHVMRETLRRASIFEEYLRGEGDRDG